MQGAPLRPQPTSFNIKMLNPHGLTPAQQAYQRTAQKFGAQARPANPNNRTYFGHQPDVSTPSAMANAMMRQIAPQLSQSIHNAPGAGITGANFLGTASMFLPGRVGRGAGQFRIRNIKADAPALYAPHGKSIFDALKQLPDLPKNPRPGRSYYARGAPNMGGSTERMPIVQHSTEKWIVAGPPGSHHGDVANELKNVTGRYHSVSDLRAHEAFKHSSHPHVSDIPSFIRWDLPAHHGNVPKGFFEASPDTRGETLARMRLIKQLQNLGTFLSTKMPAERRAPDRPSNPTAKDILNMRSPTTGRSVRHILRPPNPFRP